MLGKILLTVDAVALIVCAPFFDYNETHIFNPRWTPHAKFHGAQTISLSVLLGLATLYFTYRPLFFSSGQVGEPVAARRLRKRDSLRTALFTGTIYWIAGMASILYPGTDGVDPEFGTPGTSAGAYFHRIHGPGGFWVVSGGLICCKRLVQLPIDGYLWSLGSISTPVLVPKRGSRKLRSQSFFLEAPGWSRSVENEHWRAIGGELLNLFDRPPAS